MNGKKTFHAGQRLLQLPRALPPPRELELRTHEHVHIENNLSFRAR